MSLKWPGLPQWLSIKNPPAVQETQETWAPSLGWKIPWRKKWQPIPVFLPGKSHGQRGLAGYSPWGSKTWTQLSTCLLHLSREELSKVLEASGHCQKMEVGKRGRRRASLSMKQDPCPFARGSRQHCNTNLNLQSIFLSFVTLITAFQWDGPFYDFHFPPQKWDKRLNDFPKVNNGLGTWIQSL